MATKAIFDARRGRFVAQDGTPGPVLRHDFHEHKFLLTGFLRCGKTLPDGTTCNGRLRINWQRHCVQHIYACPAKTEGGCGGLSRRGDKVDEFISEAVLAKLEEREASAAESLGPWPHADELAAIDDQIRELSTYWRQRKITSSTYFEQLPLLENDRSRLRNERERYALAVERATTNLTDIRRRWYSDEDEDRLDLSQKRAYIREALLAVIIYPAGKGNGSRGRFNPDLLEPIWREE